VDDAGAAMPRAVRDLAVRAHDRDGPRLGGLTHSADDPVVRRRGEDHTDLLLLGSVVALSRSRAVEHHPERPVPFEVRDSIEQTLAMRLGPPSLALIPAKEAGVQDVETVQ